MQFPQSPSADLVWIGQTLVAENFDPGGGVSSAASTIYTQWFAPGGEAGVFAMDIQGISVAGTNTSPRLRMIVQTKNFDQLDSSATDQATGTYTTAGLQTALNASGLKQLVRIKVVLDDSAASPVARVFCACFRVLAPQWKTN